MRSIAGTARSTGVIVGLTIAVLIGTAALLAITHSNSASRQQRLVVGSYEILSLMRQTVIALQDSEIGQRAYLLSGQASDLEPYERARLRIETGRVQGVCGHARQQIKDRRLRCRVRHGFFPFVG